MTVNDIIDQHASRTRQAGGTVFVEEKTPSVSITAEKPKTNVILHGDNALYFILDADKLVQQYPTLNYDTVLLALALPYIKRA